MKSKEALIIEQLFMIADKQGNDVDFTLNHTQATLDASLTGRDIVPKARQEGVSAYVLGRFLAACMMYRNTRAVVISHDMESTQRLLARVHYYIEHIKGPQPVIRHSSKNHISFPKMNSDFYIGTAGSREFGRGDTITHLHCSEYAFWSKPKLLMKGLLQAVPMTGEIIIESTGNGYNDYHSRCMKAEKGQSVWGLHFFNWLDFPEYELSLDDVEKEYLMTHLNKDWEEDFLYNIGISLEKIAWRRFKLDELDYDLSAFKQEYPMTLDECFQMTSKSIFHMVQYEPTAAWKNVDRGGWMLDGHPRADKHYMVGADVAGGVGADASVVEIFCLEDMEQVGEYINNKIDPETFAYEIARIARYYNNAFCVVENNNHGILTLSVLDKIYDKMLIYKDDSTVASNEEKEIFQLGYKTTKRNKPLMIGRLRVLLARQVVIHSPILRGELTTFIETETGALEAQDGCNDDTVMASACALLGINKTAMIKSQDEYTPTVTVKPDPFALDSIIEQLRSGSQEYPISFQNGETIN